METTLTYKCPNCDAGLLFDADKQLFSCEFCLSEFSEEELLAQKAHEKAEKAAKANEDFTASMNEYFCPSCGAEVVADKNTVSAFCYYCHNPIVLSDKVSGLHCPAKIIPFKLSKAEVGAEFLRYAKKKKFLPRNYFTDAVMENITGVYYPFYITDADTDSSINAVGKTVRSWRQGDYRYTETKTYAVYRRGNIHFEDIATSAISTEDKAMLEGILPFPKDAYIDFSMPYLQGFFSKKKDIEREALQNEVKGRMQGYATTLLRGTATGYSSLDVQNSQLGILSSHWEYSLLPVWILTYTRRGKTKDKDKTYLYAMNGHTGKFYGEFPVSIPKLLLASLGVFLGAAALAFLLGFLFFL